MVRSYVISVSLAKGCYRHIRIPASATLYQLHKAILAAFGFEDDHAHAFFMDNCYWSPFDPYFSMKMRGDEILTTKRTLKKLNLHKGDKFKYVFDFGDEWRFQCKVLQELEEETDITAVIRAMGDAPEQYPELSEEESDVIPETYEKEEIIKLYAQLNLPEELIVNVHGYFEAAANLLRIPVKRRARSGGTVRPFQRKRRSRSILNGVKRRPSVLSDQRSQFLTELRPLVS